MLSPTDIRALVDGIEYRPGWTFEVYETEAQGWWIAINAEVQDAYEPTRDVPLRIKSPLPPFRHDLDFLAWLRWRVERIEVHECHEWLRWKDNHKPIWDPHQDGADEPRWNR